MKERLEAAVDALREWLTRPLFSWLILSGSLLIAAMVAAIFFSDPAPATKGPLHEQSLAESQGVPPLSSEQLAKLATGPTEYEALSPDRARAENALIPIAAGPIPMAAPFIIARGDPNDYARAVACLTAAIYYEAGNEGDQGKRAVAQVVLNRLRHPLYPKTVCGVVFQGSERKTGCQFTFACDGSIFRMPEPRRWAQAQALSELALTGRVEPSVGWATHYHADYVVPYWAPTLIKTVIIGRHIFYRLPGDAGSPRTFQSASVAAEPTIAAMKHLPSMETGEGNAPDPAQLEISPPDISLPNDLSSTAIRPDALREELHGQTGSELEPQDEATLFPVKPDPPPRRRGRLPM